MREQKGFRRTGHAMIVIMAVMLLLWTVTACMALAESSMNWMPVMMADEEGSEAGTVLGSNIPRTSIRTISFLRTKRDVGTGAWDVSESQNGSVLAWVVRQDEFYDLYIAGDDGVNLNENSRNLFANYDNLMAIAFNGCVYTSDVADMSGMFSGDAGLVMLDLSGFDTSHATDMSRMFMNCSKLAALNVGEFNTSNVTDMSSMFQNCANLGALDVSCFDTSHVTDMYAMFDNCSKLAGLNVSGFDTSGVTNMRAMFENCVSLRALNVSGFNTAKVTDMSFMFNNCSNLNALDVSGFNTGNVTGMSTMFQNCAKIVSVDVSGFDTANVVDMSYMFYGCASLAELDVNALNLSGGQDTRSMFTGCRELAALGALSEQVASAGLTPIPVPALTPVPTAVWGEIASAPVVNITPEMTAVPEETPAMEPMGWLMAILRGESGLSGEQEEQEAQPEPTPSPEETLPSEVQTWITPIPMAVPETTSTPESVSASTPEPVSVSTPEPVIVSTPKPEPTPYAGSTAQAVEASEPANWIRNGFVVDGMTRLMQANRDQEIDFGDPEKYATYAGVYTFRGGPLRQNAAYGTAEIEEEKLNVLSTPMSAGMLNSSRIGFGYGSQPAIVKWHQTIRGMMNLNAEAADTSSLKEVIYSSNDGKIYFFDLDTRRETRSAINVGLPLNAAASVDPKGRPLLYIGQTESTTASGDTGVIGMRTYSLMDQTIAAFQSGIDANAMSSSGVVSSSALLEPGSDTLIYTAENGMLYTISLNTVFTADGTLELEPEVVSYGYDVANTRYTQRGIRASAAAYGSYVYFGDMSGIIQCVDLNTMQCVWAYNMGDSVVANVALECHDDGSVDLYAGNVVNLRAASGTVSLVKLNALTGELIWECGTDIRGKYASAPAAEGIYAGLMASPLIGEGDIDDLVIFNVNHVDELGTNSEFYAVVYALDKNTGEEVWRQPMYVDSLSSPIAMYCSDGTSYIVMGDENGTLHLMDGYYGLTVDYVELGSAIRSSPAAYDNQIVVGTTEGKICFVEVN